jgi:hypothetical protein
MIPATNIHSEDHDFLSVEQDRINFGDRALPKWNSNLPFSRPKETNPTNGGPPYEEFDFGECQDEYQRAPRNKFKNLYNGRLLDENRHPGVPAEELPLLPEQTEAIG